MGLPDITPGMKTPITAGFADSLSELPASFLAQLPSKQHPRVRTKNGDRKDRNRFLELPRRVRSFAAYFIMASVGIFGGAQKKPRRISRAALEPIGSL
jgi:hypothetical protein